MYSHSCSPQPSHSCCFWNTLIIYHPQDFCTCSLTCLEDASIFIIPWLAPSPPSDICSLSHSGHPWAAYLKLPSPILTAQYFISSLHILLFSIELSTSDILSFYLPWSTIECERHKGKGVLSILYSAQSPGSRQSLLHRR